MTEGASVAALIVVGSSADAVLADPSFNDVKSVPVFPVATSPFPLTVTLSDDKVVCSPPLVAVLVDTGVQAVSVIRHSEPAGYCRERSLTDRCCSIDRGDPKPKVFGEIGSTNMNLVSPTKPALAVRP
jgi:hypothetical protein